MKRDSTLIVIGPSTGWLYARDIFSLTQQGRFLKETKANAVELSGREDSRRVESLLSDEELGEFCHVSFHLPDYTGSKLLAEQVSLVEKIVKRRNPMHCLVHPSGVPLRYLEALTVRNIPLVIENMDGKKNSGYDIKELEGLLRNFKLGFVFDVQHAFEHDSTMEYAFDLFQMAKRKLAYFHVSGETENSNHALVCRSRNCEAIIGFLGTIFSETHVPVILEGEYTTPEEINQEINFLTSKLKAVG